MAEEVVSIPSNSEVEGFKNVVAKPASLPKQYDPGYDDDRCLSDRLMTYENISFIRVVLRD